MSFKKRTILTVVFGIMLLFAFQKPVFAMSFDFKYKTLEAFPGFFAAGNDATDLPELILAIYKFGIWTVGIAGLFMLVVGGFWYMSSAGNTARAGTAKSMIADSILGIVIALSAYVILYVINPDLGQIHINFKAVSLEEEGIEDETTANPPASTIPLADVVKPGQYPISKQVAADLADLKSRGINSSVTSGIRTIERQKQLVRDYCGGTWPSAAPCRPSVCRMPTGDPKECPHTTGMATDIWAIGPDGKQALTQKQCLANLAACFANPYQAKLIAEMKLKGYCVLNSEPWHFEKPKMSGACNF